MGRTIRFVFGVLLALMAVGSCGGGAGSGEDARTLQLIVHESTALRFHATVFFASPIFVRRDEGGESFTEVQSDGCQPGGNDGEPGVPLLTRLLAVPQGARAVLTDVRTVVAEVRSLRCFPYQAQDGDYSPAFEAPGPIPVGEDEWRPPFAYDRTAYTGTRVFPSGPVELSPVSIARDLSVASIQVASGQFAAGTGVLTLFRSVELTVVYVGGSTRFLADGAGNPFEEGSKTAKAATWNHDAIENPAAFDIGLHVNYGEELLILTHPTYRSAADRLAAHKNGRGLVTTVINVNDGPGGGPDTKEEIKAFLDARYAAAAIRFSYLLLLGDAQDIAPFVLPRRYKEDDFPSDFPYAQIATDPMADDLVPEIAVGRIPVDSLAEADVVVDKIIAYEANPPLVLPGGTFYGHAAIASYFQPGQDGSPANVENLRRFVQDSEEARGTMVAHMFDVQRIYRATLPLTEENTPRYYKDGVTLLPAPLRPEDSYPWDGDAAQITAAFNAGKTLFFHVDHGGAGGWGHPPFYTSDLPSLTNGELLPLVLSDNCSSGAFDYPSAGFAESILRKSGGGAIGVIAFTRNSNNAVGRRFLLGVVDALWPDANPDFGDDQPRHRLGDMLNHVRARMTVNQTNADPTTDAYLGAWCYARMITLFGDPTLSVWIENPNPIPMIGDQFVDGPVIELHYPLRGATITILEETADGLVPIGRGVVGADEVVHVDPIVSVGDSTALRFFASAPGAVTTEISVSVR